MISCRRILSVLVAALALLAVGLAGPASAGTGQNTDRAAFTAQARDAGLTDAQADALQSRVDGYLEKEGGRQVSPNRIDLGSGSEIVVAAPGQQHARDLAAPADDVRAAAWECPYRHFCMYRGTNGTGDRLALYHCRDHALSNWVGNGSFYNNQTPGTRAQLKNRNRAVVYTTLGAPSHHPSFNWDPIWYVKPC